MSTTTKRDIADSAKDKLSMMENEITINLPDVADIPGQENIVPAPFGELADTTISSSDEEGDELFDDDNISDDSNVTSLEKRDLKRSASSNQTEDDINLQNAALDNTD